MIMKDQLQDIKEAMLKSENMGMKTFDSALYDLVQEGRISEEEAMKFADSANNLRLRLKLTSKGENEEEDETELMLRGAPPGAGAQNEANEEDPSAENSENSEEKHQMILQRCLN